MVEEAKFTQKNRLASAGISRPRPPSTIREPPQKRQKKSTLIQSGFDNRNQLEDNPEDDGSVSGVYREENDKPEIVQITYENAHLMTPQDLRNFLSARQIQDTCPSQMSCGRGTESGQQQTGLLLYAVVRYLVNVRINETFIQHVQTFMIKSGPSFTFNLSTCVFIFPSLDDKTIESVCYLVVIPEAGHVLKLCNVAALGKLFLCTGVPDKFSITSKILPQRIVAPPLPFDYKNPSTLTHDKLSSGLQYHLSFGYKSEYSQQSDILKEIVWSLVSLHQRGNLLSMFPQQNVNVQDDHFRRGVKTNYPVEVSFDNITSGYVQRDRNFTRPFVLVGTAVDVWHQHYQQDVPSQQLIAFLPGTIVSSSFNQVIDLQLSDQYQQDVRKFSRLVKIGFMQKLEAQLTQFAKRDIVRFTSGQATDVLSQFMADPEIDLPENVIVSKFFDLTRGSSLVNLVQSLYIQQAMTGNFASQVSRSRFSISFSFTTKQLSNHKSSSSYLATVQEVVNRLTQYVNKNLPNGLKMAESILAKVTSNLSSRVDQPIPALSSLSPTTMQSLLIISFVVSGFFSQGAIPRDDVTLYISGVSGGGKTFMSDAITESLSLVKGVASLSHTDFTTFTLTTKDGGVFMDEYKPDPKKGVQRQKEFFSASKDGLNVHLKNEQCQQVAKGHVILVAGNRTPADLFLELATSRKALPFKTPVEVQDFLLPIFRKSSQILVSFRAHRVFSNMSQLVDFSQPITFTQPKTKLASSNVDSVDIKAQFQRMFSRLIIAWSLAFVVAKQSVGAGTFPIFMDNRDRESKLAFQTYFQHNDVVETLIDQFKHSECAMLSAMFDPSQTHFQSSMIDIVLKYAGQHSELLSGAVDRLGYFSQHKDIKYQQFFEDVTSGETLYASFMQVAQEIDNPTIHIPQEILLLHASKGEFLQIRNVYTCDYNVMSLTTDRDSLVPIAALVLCSFGVNPVIFTAYFVDTTILFDIRTQVGRSVQYLVDRHKKLYAAFFKPCIKAVHQNTREQCSRQTLTASRLVSACRSYTVKMFELIQLLVHNAPDYQTGVYSTDVITTTMLYQSLVKTMIDQTILSNKEAMRLKFYVTINKSLSQSLGTELKRDNTNMRRGFMHWTVADYLIASSTDAEVLQHIVQSFLINPNDVGVSFDDLFKILIPRVDEHKPPILNSAVLTVLPLTIWLGQHPVVYNYTFAKFELDAVRLAMLLMSIQSARSVLRHVLLVRSFGIFQAADSMIQSIREVIASNNPPVSLEQASAEALKYINYDQTFCDIKESSQTFDFTSSEVYRSSIGNHQDDLNHNHRLVDMTTGLWGGRQDQYNDISDTSSVGCVRNQVRYAQNNDSFHQYYPDQDDDISHDNYRERKFENSLE